MNADELSDVKQQAVELILERQFDEAITNLQAIGQLDGTGETEALLGLAHFHSSRYTESREQYEEATRKSSASRSWIRMRELARSNEEARVAEPVPPVAPFKAEVLTAPPSIPNDALPVLSTAPLARPWWQGLFVRIGQLLGVFFSLTVAFASTVWGKVAGYRRGIWTNWYRRPSILALLTLMHMRDRLNRRNLYSTYRRGELVGFQQRDLRPPPGVEQFRTADGSWNNLQNPKEGAAGTRFSRNVPSATVQTELEKDRLCPCPRKVSRVLLTRENGLQTVPFLNLLAAAWIQFQNHDWIGHGDNSVGDNIDLPLEQDDPEYADRHQRELRVPRSQPDPTRDHDRAPMPVTFINEVTHWWDGSQIYGSDWKTQDRLRSGQHGKLRLQANGMLPLDDVAGVELSGYVRNWWVGLSILHTLFVKEHNAICDQLRTAYPKWDDNRLFNVARLINAAVMAKIHTVEWTPAILPNHVLDRAMHGNWYGLLTNLFRKGKHRRTVSEINVNSPEFGGVVGNAINKHGHAYALTEEFVEVYRLHSLLPEVLEVRRIQEPDSIERVPIPRTRQAGSAKLIARTGLPDLLFSFGSQNPGALVLNNYPGFLQELSVPGYPVLDLGAVDVLRARERGVPRYNEFRREMGLTPIRSFRDLTDDESTIAKLESVYQDCPEPIEYLDLMIGTLAEGANRRPPGFGFGETMFQIFILNATRRLQADRFYTTHYNEEVYTYEGLAWIDQATLKSVLLRHYPSLATTPLAEVENAFEPWDRDPDACPDRHPLRHVG